MSFHWPWQHEFAPFYTLQPNLTSRERQLEAWASIVLDYCQHNKIYSIDVAEAQQSPLFTNSKLNRRFSVEGIRAVFDILEKQKHLEWADKQKHRCHVYWRTPEEWAKLIYDWVIANGLVDTVCTLYELTQGDDTAGESFHGLEKLILQKALSHLEAQRKAELITVAGNEGVKFFR